MLEIREDANTLTVNLCSAQRKSYWSTKFSSNDTGTEMLLLLYQQELHISSERTLWDR